MVSRDRRLLLAATLVAACLAASPACAQTLGDDRVLAPDTAELEAIERAWRARESERLFALRHRVRLTLEAGGAVALYREHVTDALTLRREAALAPMLAVGARYGIIPSFEVQARVELVAPLPLGVIDNGAFTRAAMKSCDGARAFDLAQTLAAMLTLDAGFRVRVFSSLSPFYVGASMRLSGQFSGGGDGAWAVRCVDARGATTSQIRGSVDRSTASLDVGASLETGYRFGERESWDVGLRLTVQALGTNEAGVAGAQFYVGWSL